MYLYRVEKGKEDKSDMGMYPEKPDYGKGWAEPGGWGPSNALIYWRKTNAVHSFFVRRCADGVDNCEPMLVHPEILAELYQRCLAVIEDPSLASDSLPTQSGFFFGDTDYDEWYFADLKQTVADIEERVLRNPAMRTGEYDIYYQASW